MTVIAVVNRKGGSGKSTLATQLAGCLAQRGHSVMLGDVDRQQSTAPWLKRRALQGVGGAPIVGWAVDPKNVLRPPAGVAHVVLDTPGGLHGFDLKRLLMHADVVLIPLCDSAFDRESAAACFAELQEHPRVASGRCRVAAVGSRIDARTHGEQALRQWALSLGLPFIGSLRAAQIYVRCVERGLTIFDAPEAKAQGDRALWQPILDWLAADLDAPAPAAVPSPAPAALAAARPPALARMGSQPRPLPLNEVLVRPPLAVLRTSNTAGPWAGMRRLVGLLLPPRRA